MNAFFRIFALAIALVIGIPVALWLGLPPSAVVVGAILATAWNVVRDIRGAKGGAK